MKERTDLPIVGLALDRKSGVPLYRQIYAALRELILQSRLRPGQRLPPSRTLTKELCVSRNTVLLAYDCLLSEGYIEGEVGAGTFVSHNLPEEALHATQYPGLQHRSKRTDAGSLSRRGRQISEIRYSTCKDEQIRPFRHGVPALDEFPAHVWSRLVARQWRRVPASHLGYGDPAGLLPLREAVAAYLRTARAVNCEPEQVLIVTGSQQGLDLTTRMLLDAGDKVWLEDPGYLGARGALLAAGAQLCPLPLDDEGIRLDIGISEYGSARMVYVTPSHQYPTGVTMSLSRRLQLLEWAGHTGAWILEDDYDSEYRYGERPLASLQGLDRNGRVIYIGTFSKVLFPALRLGYLVAPPNLVSSFSTALATSSRSCPLIDQAALAAFIDEGHFGRHIRKMRILYQQRHDALISLIERECHGLIQIKPSKAGMHLVGWLAEGQDDKAVAETAERAGILAPPLSAYSLRHPHAPGLILGYTAFAEQEMADAVAMLAEVLTEA